MSLIRKRIILERLGGIDEAGIIKLREGNAPTITKDPYAGEFVTGDHIIPRALICLIRLSLLDVKICSAFRPTSSTPEAR